MSIEIMMEGGPYDGDRYPFDIDPVPGSKVLYDRQGYGVSATYLLTDRSAEDGTLVAEFSQEV